MYLTFGIDKRDNIHEYYEPPQLSTPSGGSDIRLLMPFERGKRPVA